MILQVALNRFIDDVSVLGIENCLIGKVPELFRSTKILKLSPEDISRLAGETAESSVERDRLEEKREILNAGLQDLVGLKKQRHVSGSIEKDPEEVKSRLERIVPTSPKVSVTTSVNEVSSAVNSRDEVTPSVDEDSGFHAVPRQVPWREQELQMTRDHEWNFAVATNHGDRR
jgi:hypothetical protein